MEYLAICAILYFVPMIIAVARKCDSTGAIIIISLLLGWFPLVTLICIAWAICGRTQKRKMADAKLLAQAIAERGL